MKKDKQHTVIDKKELFNYLDGYAFIDDEEIQLAICNYIENQEGKLFYPLYFTKHEKHNTPILCG